MDLLRLQLHLSRLKRAELLHQRGERDWKDNAVSDPVIYLYHGP